MKLIAIADDDSRVGFLEPPDCDILVSLGDLHDSTLERACDRYCPKRAFAVRGNHDRPDPLPDPFQNLHLQTATFEGLTFGGFEGSWRYKAKGWHLYEQQEVEASLKDFPTVDVFIAHNSPRGIHERDDSIHQGFDAFRHYIQSHQPKLFLHGHQHRPQESQIGSTRVVGVFGEVEILLP